MDHSAKNNVAEAEMTKADTAKVMEQNAKTLEQQPGKRKTGLILGLVSCLIFLVLLAGLFIQRYNLKQLAQQLNETNQKYKDDKKQHEQAMQVMSNQINAFKDEFVRYDDWQKLTQKVQKIANGSSEASITFLKLNGLMQNLLQIMQDVYRNDWQAAIAGLDFMITQQNADSEQQDLLAELKADRAALQQAYIQQQALYQLYQQIFKDVAALPMEPDKYRLQHTETQTTAATVLLQDVADGLSTDGSGDNKPAPAVQASGLWYRVKWQIERLWAAWLQRFEIEKVSESGMPYLGKQTSQWLKQQLFSLNHLAYLQLQQKEYHAFDDSLNMMEQQLKYYYDVDYHFLSDHPLMLSLDKLKSYKQNQQAQPLIHLISLEKVKEILNTYP